jgi:hypothetical protein
VNLVDGHPLVAAVDAKLADLERRRLEFEARVAPLAEADAKAEADHLQAVDRALLEGAAMPPPLVRRIPEGRDVEIRHGFMRETELLNEERRKAVAAVYPDVLDQAGSQSTKLVKAARPTVQKLTAAMAELGELLRAVKICRDAANAENPNGRTPYHDTPMTVEEFIRIVASSGDPIDVLDMTGNRPVRPRTTGMLWGDISQLIEDTPGGGRVRK